MDRRIKDINPTFFNSLALDFIPSIISASELDILYIWNHSGEKFATPLLCHLYDDYPTSFNNVAATLIKDVFLDKWKRLWEVFVTTVYNPLNNYDMIENEKSATKVISNADSSNDVYGFNSSTAVPSDKASVTTTTEGSDDDNHRELTRSGNIGVTTTQQMMESEFELRKKNIIAIMMDDIDSLMALSYYG